MPSASHIVAGLSAVANENRGWLDIGLLAGAVYLLTTVGLEKHSGDRNTLIDCTA